MGVGDPFAMLPPMTISPRVAAARREWHRIGKPENMAAIDRLVEAGESVPESLLNFSGVTPEVETNKPEAYQPPPRSGPGASAKNWKRFASNAIEIDDDVLRAMDRDDVIEMLETRGVIQPLPPTP